MVAHGAANELAPALVWTGKHTVAVDEPDLGVGVEDGYGCAVAPEGRTLKQRIERGVPVALVVRRLLRGLWAWSIPPWLRRESLRSPQFVVFVLQRSEPC